jgi:hypothetical protein
VLALDRHKSVAGLNWLMGSQPFPLDNLKWQYIYKQIMKKPAQLHFHSKSPPAITKMNDNINMDSIYY